MEIEADPKELEAHLKQLQKKIDAYETIFKEIEDGYAEIDLHGRVESCNPALCRIIGYTVDELTGMDYREYMDADTAAKVYQAHNEVFKTSVPKKSFNYEITGKDASKHIVEISIALRKDDAGNPDGFRIFMRDVTERRIAEQELYNHKSRLEAIFRSVKDAIITVDPDMNIIDANESAKTICGISSDEMGGHDFSHCQWGGCQPCRDVLSETLNKKKAIYEYQVECSRRDRPHQKVILSSAPLLNGMGGFSGAVLVIRDITRINDLENELKMRHRFHNIVGKNAKMQELYKLIEDLADFETTVLIAGESGTGKELVARALHQSGRRALKPFIAVNCSALAENLLESELFGHVKGAFTGAIHNMQGRFQKAHTGTLLLDEIGDISPRIQLKLLRVLQEKTFERVGDAKEIEVDVRVIACTNQDLNEKVRRGEFREDLYYRLKVVELKVPPLRERKDDIPLLVEYFKERYQRKFNIAIPGIANDVLRTFMDYSWPGNVRELEHSMERAAVLCHGQAITLKQLPPELKESIPAGKQVHPQSTAEEPEQILSALDKTDWNKAKAARLLHISRNTLYRKMRKHGLARSTDPHR
ncbi:sigma-54-dependent Fis family transcriptional regulator [Desulfosarcina widdelii]|uniref:Sigma-54-dependent Fis family transcriptional regulator n=1 Tax=Desulfosarcina widdelii TaxID=947919 RepID=A0A5K7Z4A7_9BACT|nr:sigma 54-interacting transcriptional regulator [Desulfosarcina widdelii]BBO75565.1 sigma-54-dependent Fis family transcriptional regulator [Desulfosarcina widdelii]